MAEIRTYQRKLKQMANDFNTYLMYREIQQNTPEFDDAFKYFNNKWIIYCNTLQNKAVKPSRNAFKTYIDLCR